MRPARQAAFQLARMCYKTLLFSFHSLAGLHSSADRADEKGNSFALLLDCTVCVNCECVLLGGPWSCVLRQVRDCQQGELRTQKLLHAGSKLVLPSLPTGPNTKACFATDTPLVRKAVANKMLDPRSRLLGVTLEFPHSSLN